MFYCFRTPPRNLDKKTTITIGDQTFVVEADDLEKICDLGRGAYGVVEKMRHIPSGTIMAVKVNKYKFYICVFHSYIATSVPKVLIMFIENNCNSEYPRAETFVDGFGYLNAFL